ncbi:SPOSA6832_01463 [Sporobolomyces salmonicolor]|uniref:alcohol dehydrogenase n=1 Tax=Sporidiobolus salmonicolor TaxID=5005 RepID=A0A0D6EIS3_SPOSA|nr:SPOSA6832_01463 [Sporobolomyces salmonicolor]
MLAAQGIPKMAAAVAFDETGGPITFRPEHPVKQPGELKPGEVLVKVEYTDTDLHAYKGDWPIPSKRPLVGGHEGTGPIVAIAGKSSRLSPLASRLSPLASRLSPLAPRLSPLAPRLSPLAPRLSPLASRRGRTNLRLGQNVGLKWMADSCLNCELCRTGYESSCPQLQLHGFTVDGSFQQYAVSFARHVTPIPEGLPLSLASPILCGGLTVYKAIKNCRTKATTAIGLQVVAIDTGDDKKKLCASYGADKFVDFMEHKDPAALIDAVKKVCDGLGPHAAVIAAAGAAAYEQALQYLRPSGTLVAVGLPHDAYIKANVFWTVLRNLHIVGSHVGNRQDAIEALDFAARGKVAPRIEIAPLSKLPEVYDRMDKGLLPGRVVLKNF